MAFAEFPGASKGRRPVNRSLVIVLALLVLAAVRPTAQAPSSATDAARAYREGRFDDVDRLLQSATDPRSVAIRARAAVARGRYAEAQKMLAGPAASAPTSDAALELALLDEKMGRRDNARQSLDRLADGLNAQKSRTVADWMRFGTASRALGRLALSGADRKAMFQDADTAFGEAAKLAPNDPQIPTALGELWADANDPAPAAKYYQAALKMDETNPEALVGFAELLVDQNPPDARAAVERAIKVNPSYERAHLLAAEMALDDRRRPDARASVARALAVNPDSLDALSLDAAIAYLEGRQSDFDAKVQRVLAIQPKYGEVYRVAGDHAARNYRFEEAVELTRKAVALDPDNNRAYADLGMHLLRTGDETGARAALERSFSRDATDLVTYNLLDLLDRLDKFDVVREGNIIMKFEPGEAAVMREQALPFARQALDSLAKRWNVEIKGPILIEMFPKHDDFAVRNLGLPGMIGALGACFGRVVTIDSPHARPPGEYNWQPTLWHELAHVVSLQLSSNRVPRWLTEGISVWEERRGRPEWGWEMEVPFAQAMDAGKIFKLNVLNEGFSDPEMISLAYHQASLVAEHLAKAYGEAAMTKLLQAYGRGLETDAAVKEAFNVTLDDIQKSFDAELERHYRPLITALKAPEVKGPLTLEDLKQLASSNPGSFRVQISLGRALAKADDTDGAIAAFERAAALVPWATGDDNPNKEIAKIALAKKDNARAITALEAVLKVDHADVEAARALVPLVAKAPPAQMENAYQRLVDVDPFEASAHAVLGRLAMQRRDGPAAVKAYRTALAINPPDRAAALVDLGEAYLLARQPAQARTQALAAMEIAPSFERAQDLLLTVVEGGRTEN